MNRWHQSFNPAPDLALPLAPGEAANHRDEEVALGCECADPSLQIECWRQEAPRPLRELD